MSAGGIRSNVNGHTANQFTDVVRAQTPLLAISTSLCNRFRARYRGWPPAPLPPPLEPPPLPLPPWDPPPPPPDSPDRPPDEPPPEPPLAPPPRSPPPPDRPAPLLSPNPRNFLARSSCPPLPVSSSDLRPPCRGAQKLLYRSRS